MAAAMTPAATAKGKARQLQKMVWYLAISLGALILLWFALRSVSFSELGRVLAGVSLRGVLLLLGLNTVIPFAVAFRGWYLIKAAGGHLSFLVFTGYRLAAGVVSFITPGPQCGGEPLQVLWLTRRHGIAPQRAIAAVALDRGVELAVNFGMLWCGLSLLVGGSTGRVRISPLALFGLALLALLPLLYGLNLRAGRRPLARLVGCGRPRLTVLLQAEHQAAALCGQRPALFAGALFFSAVTWSLLLSEFWLVFYLLGCRLSFPQLLMAMAIARCAFLTPIPGGLGALEASLVFAAEVLSLPPAAALAAAALIRGRDALIAMTGLSLAAHYSRGGRPVAAPEPPNPEADDGALLPG